jgi:hypothetical protein
MAYIKGQDVKSMSIFLRLSTQQQQNLNTRRIVHSLASLAPHPNAPSTTPQLAQGGRKRSRKRSRKGSGKGSRKSSRKRIIKKRREERRGREDDVELYPNTRM